MGFNQQMAFRDCPWCGLRHAQMQVLAHNTVAKRPPGQPERAWSLLSCPECGGAVAVEHNAPNTNPGREISVVPEGTLGTEIEGLPEQVSAYYADAVKVLQAGVPDAATVQLRRTLEAAAAVYEVQEKSLIKSIEKLIAQGHVTQSFGKALHHIRLLGNLGAHHSDERIDDAAARRALRFTTQLLRNLFEVPHELQILEQEAPASVDADQ